MGLGADDIGYLFTSTEISVLPDTRPFHSEGLL